MSLDGVIHSIGLEFVEFPGTHTGLHIAEKVEDVMTSYGLEKRVIAIVVDNAENNTVAIRELSGILKLNDKTFPTTEELHMRCFGHVMNLGAKGKILEN